MLCYKASHDSRIERPASARRRLALRGSGGAGGGGRGIEAERTGVYQATAEELAAIDRGLDDVGGGRFAAAETLDGVRAKFRGRMIVRWTAGALAELAWIDNYQRLHWPQSRAVFEQRLTAIERRLAEFPLSAPEVAQRPGVRVAAFRDLPYRAFLQRRASTRSMFWSDTAHVAPGVSCERGEVPPRLRPTRKTPPAPPCRWRGPT